MRVTMRLIGSAPVTIIRAEDGRSNFTLAEGSQNTLTDAANFQYANITDEEPDPGDFAAWIRLERNEDGTLDTSPISTFYGSADESQQLERDLADGGTAVLSLDEDGRPSVIDVVGD